jgi:hypothetical protein
MHVDYFQERLLLEMTDCDSTRSLSEEPALCNSKTARVMEKMDSPVKPWNDGNGSALQFQSKREVNESTLNSLAVLL